MQTLRSLLRLGRISAGELSQFRLFASSPAATDEDRPYIPRWQIPAESHQNCSQFQLREFGSKFVEIGSTYSVTLDQDPGSPVNGDSDPRSGSRFLITSRKKSYSWKWKWQNTYFFLGNCDRFSICRKSLQFSRRTSSSSNQFFFFFFEGQFRSSTDLIYLRPR